MKKLLNKNSYLIILITVLVGMIIHFSIYTKNLLSADILLYDSYYNSYLWEISLGRFGLFIVGLLFYVYNKKSMYRCDKIIVYIDDKT